MAKYIHNSSLSVKEYQGRSIQVDEFFLIQPHLESEYMTDNTLIADLANSVVKMSSNGTTSISGSGSSHVDFLKGIDLSPKDSDGSPLQRVKVTNAGWNYQLHGIELETSVLDSIISMDAEGNNYNFCTLKFYENINDVETLIEGGNLNQTYLDSNCIKTVLDWEPTHDIELIGGVIKQITVPTSDIRLWTVGVPDVPAIYGGSKCFVSNLNLKYIGLEEGIKADGKAAKALAYSPVYHSNKMQTILRHDAGIKHKIHMIYEIFKA